MKKCQIKSLSQFLGVFLILLSGIITNSACLTLFGEVPLPKSLQDK